MDASLELVHYAARNARRLLAHAERGVSRPHTVRQYAADRTAYGSPEIGLCAKSCSY